MAAVTLLVLFFAWTSPQEVESHSITDLRLSKIQNRVERIEDQLSILASQDGSCNDTIRDVTGRMKNVSDKIPSIYAGPICTKMNFARGDRNSGKLLIIAPDPFEACLRRYKGTPVDKQHAKLLCIQQVLWRYKFPVTKRKVEQDQMMVSKFKINLQPREPHKVTKEQGQQVTLHTTAGQHVVRKGRSLLMVTSTMTPSTPNVPTTTTTSAPRVRKEYRTLNLTERTRFHNALNALYQKGVIASFANTHRRANRGAHRGPAFLPWHRVFITLFEDALREEDPSVTLPYWDSTIDDQMDNPTNSRIWSADFLGNGAGQVVTGDFANWATEQGFLERSYGERGSLVRKINLERTLTRCSYSEITVPTGRRRFRIESYHNGLHSWVGGDMRFVGTASFDPVFFLHHCFIDYVWQKFRERQIECGVDPETDYVNATGRHNFNSRMGQITDYRVKDGLSNSWHDVFRYEESPSCENNCGGTDELYCDALRNTCLPRSRFDTPVFTTSTFPTTPVGMARKKRAAEDDPGEKGREEIDGVVDEEEQEASSSDCDTDGHDDSQQVCNVYLDPGCHYANIIKLAAENKPIPTSEEVEIVNLLVPRNRGEEFAVEENDERTLRTTEVDAVNFEKTQKRLLLEFKASLEKKVDSFI